LTETSISEINSIFAIIGRFDFKYQSNTKKEITNSLLSTALVFCYPTNMIVLRSLPLQCLDNELSRKHFLLLWTNTKRMWSKAGDKKIPIWVFLC